MRRCFHQSQVAARDGQHPRDTQRLSRGPASRWWRFLAFSCCGWGIGFLNTAALADTGFEIYGELNAGFLILNDGSQTDNLLVDNTTIPSRLGVRYQGPQTESGTIRLTVETGLPQDAKSFAVNQVNQPDFFDFQFDETDLRLFQVEWDMPSGGRISAGQGWMSTFLNGASDLSGTNNIAATSMPTNNGGGRLVRTDDGVLTAIPFAGGIDRLFGSRRFRLRYDSPSLSGFTLSGSIGREILIDDDDQTYIDASVRYASSFLIDGFDVLADIGYSSASEARDYVNSSVAFLHRDTGLNLQLAFGAYDDGSHYVNGKLGIIRDVFGLGDDYQSALALQHFRGDDLGVDGSSFQYTSLSAVQYLGPSLQLYATYALQSYDDGNDAYQDGSAALLGLRYLF